jgi:hypothetical protein
MVRDMSGIDTDVKPELRVGGRTCQCAECELFFTGVYPFDLHLATEDDNQDLRCLTPDEMRALGMTTNKHGVWQRGTAHRRVEDDGDPGDEQEQSPADNWDDLQDLRAAR